VVGALARPLKLDVFNTGDYLGAVAEEARAESICKFLYPNDESPAGRELRLRQEYFFVSASLQDLVDRHLASDGQLRSLATKAAVQLNDTHPSLAVTELMRILVDLHNFRWDEAWRITVATLSYTNHTLLPEALETWPVDCSSACCRGTSTSSTASMSRIWRWRNNALPVTSISAPRSR